MAIQRTATFTASTDSGVIDLRSAKILTFHTSTLAGGSTSMTFKGAPTSEATATVLKDDAGNTISITVAANQAIVVTDSVKALAVAGLAYAQLVLDQTETTTIEVIGTP